MAKTSYTGAAAVGEDVADVAGDVCAMPDIADRKNNAAITDFAIILAPFWVMIRLLKKV
jgi:hypothetical protein